MSAPLLWPASVSSPTREWPQPTVVFQSLTRDSYDIFAIGLVTSMLGVVYWHAETGSIPESSDTAIKVATSGGTVLGQVGFGYLADVVGRKRMYGLELILIIFATLAQALSCSSPAITITGVIIFWRVLMGIGIGGGRLTLHQPKNPVHRC